MNIIKPVYYSPIKTEWFKSQAVLWIVIYWLIIPITTFAQSDQSYLKHNLYSWNDTTYKEDKMLSLFQKGLDSSNIIFVGEWHNLKGNSSIEWTLFRHLYNNQGVRKIVFELPLSYELALNEFVLNGYEREKVKEMCYFDTAAFLFFEKLYQFNQTVNEKVKICAFDIEVQNFYITIPELYRLLPLSEPPASIAKTIQRLEYMNGEVKYPQLKRWFKKFAKTLYADMQSNEIIYKAYLGESYDRFKRIAKGFYIGVFDKTYSLDTALLHKRERMMYENFLSSIKEDEKMLALTGKFHICLKPEAEWLYEGIKFTSIAAMLNTYSNSPVKGKVSSILIQYPHYNYDINVIPQEDLEILLYHSQHDFTIFRLTPQNSSYTELMEKFHYLIINKK